MRLQCSQENLAKGLLIVSRAVSSRSTLPILGNILLEASDCQLRLSATNLEISISCWIGAVVEDEGSITVPAALLASFVASLPAEKIDMELAVRSQTLHLKCIHYEANIKGIDAVNFPILPTLCGGGSDTIDMESDSARIAVLAADLRGLVNQVSFAASTDESRPTLTGVEVSVSDGGIKMRAMDGYRLSLRQMGSSNNLNLATSDKDITVTVPAKSLNELARISTGGDENEPIRAIISQSRGQVLFEITGKGEEVNGAFHKAELVSQLIESRLPDVGLPDEYATRAVVKTDSMLKAVRLASLFAHKNSNIVRIGITPSNSVHNGQMRLAAASHETGDNISEIEASIDGDELEIAFNSKYLLDILSRIEHSQVVLETTKPTRPGIMRPMGAEHDECLHLMMPMHLPQ